MPLVVPGDAVLNLLRAASGSILIAAPYIKSPTLRRLIAEIPTSVRSFTCITRWLPEDIASGACDIEIFEDVTAHVGGRLLLHPHLHAKYYRSDGACLVGSANLSGRGLGWNVPPNIELLVELPTDFQGLSEWERALVDSTVPVTPELRDQIVREAERLGEKGHVPRAPEVGEDTEEEMAPHLWVPVDRRGKMTP